MLIGPNTPGYIAPGKKYAHVPNWDNRPVPDPAPNQEVIDSEGTCAKVFQDVRTGKTTLLIG